MMQTKIGKFKILGEIPGEAMALSISRTATLAISVNTVDITAPLNI